MERNAPKLDFFRHANRKVVSAQLLSRSSRLRRFTINPLLIVQEAEHERSSRILHERKQNTQDETSMKLVLDRLIRKPPNQAIVVIRQPN